MRILVLAAGAGGRLATAAVGLADRGHAVSWLGPGAAAHPALRPIGGARDLWATRADVVASDDPRPLRPAIVGWLARAHCLVLQLGRDGVRRWRPLDSWAWHSLHAHGLLEPAEADRFRADSLGLDPARLALWSGEPIPPEPRVAHPDTEILERACERALARHRGRGPRPAVFLDRDGTLVREVGYLADPGDLEILPGVPEALRGLQAAGYSLVVVSNQSGVGRGIFGMARAHETMARLRTLLRDQGVELDAIYFCPHRPEDGCACRKPAIGLLERAAEDLQLSLGLSVVVGDKLLDVETARRAGARGILVRSGYGREEEPRIDRRGPAPDQVCDDLGRAAAWVLAHPAGPL